MPRKLPPIDHGGLIRHEGILNAAQYIDGLSAAINSAQRVVNLLKDNNRSEHSDYLDNQILPNFRNHLEHLTQALEGSKGFGNSKSDNDNRKKVTDIMYGLKNNFDYFERFVGEFDGDRNYSFKDAKGNFKTNLDRLVISLNQAGLRLDYSKEIQSKKSFAEREINKTQQQISVRGA